MIEMVKTCKGEKVMKLTKLDQIEWCKSHRCTEESCEYLRGYCHIEENMEEQCVYCTLEGSCRRCKYALNHSFDTK